MIFGKRDSTNDPLRTFQSSLYGLLEDIEERKVSSLFEANRRFREMKKILRVSDRFTSPKTEDDKNLIERINIINSSIDDKTISDLGDFNVQLKHLFNHCQKISKAA